MRDGTYSLCLRADGYNGAGTAHVRDNVIDGHDGQYALTGQLMRSSDHITGVFDINLDPRAVGNTRMPSTFSLSTTGNGNGDAFELVGAGPLGLIIELVGTWKSPL